MGKEELVKKLAAELDGKPPAWSSGFKLGILHLGKLFEEDAQVLKDPQKTKEYMTSKLSVCVSEKLKHQTNAELEEINKGFNHACSFAKVFRGEKDWKEEDRNALYDAILALFSIPIPTERRK